VLARNGTSQFRPSSQEYFLVRGGKDEDQTVCVAKSPNLGASTMLLAPLLRRWIAAAG